MRVGIIAIQHESNTFLHTPTGLAEFRADTLLTGTAIREKFQHSHHELGGFFAALDDAAIEAVPLLAAIAVPCGKITADCATNLLQLLAQQLDAMPALDGFLVAPHGAAVSEIDDDFDGYWLQWLRQRLGADIPIICTLDLHANLSQRMIDACNATIGYRSNPHLDQYQRGMEAAVLMTRCLHGKVHPTQAATMPAFAINIERQQTAASPCRELIQLADQQLQPPGVLSNTVLLGFPYADVADMGSAFIVVTDNDRILAQTLARQLADYLWQHKQDFIAELISIEQALSIATQAHLSGPSCLLDMGDNVGGGSAADSTYLAHALHRQTDLRGFVALYDPQAVQQATAAGVGTTVTLAMGGKTDRLHGLPLQAEVTIVSLHNGMFQEPDPRHGGRSHYAMGATAIVQTNTGLTIQLTSKRTPPFSLGQLTSCGLNPTAFDVLVAKGVVAPQAAYEAVCSQFIRVNTAGSTSADMRALPYKKRRQPMFPFESVT